jgi:isopenicillin N synthase-like dioxygenase
VDGGAGTRAVTRRPHVPLIDVAPLVRGADDRAVANAIDESCRNTGFFAIVGHGVDPALCARVDAAARAFFARPEHEKAAIAMERGGRAWRGWFPVGGELTSAVPDRKEGIYFGAELGPDEPRVRAGVPLHGPNLFPREPAALRPAVLAYLDALTTLGHTVMRGIALGLGLDADWFARDLTREPTILFRIFRYPPVEPAATEPRGWGVGEHTDYGLLTILGQDPAGGLQVHTPDGWIDVAPRPDAFVCNIGDMLERMTAGQYRSTPHRVRSPQHGERLSFPFFFDPGWDAVVRAVPGLAAPAVASGRRRWDGADVHAIGGTYGEYLVGKVSKVFPALRDDVL